jgi:hypothetical protein
MSIDTLRSFLLWCGIINYGFLILWIGLYLFAPRLLHWVSRLYRLSPETCDSIQFTGIVFYKTAIFFFNLIPYVALRIVA